MTRTCATPNPLIFAIATPDLMDTFKNRNLYCANVVRPKPYKSCVYNSRYPHKHYLSSICINCHPVYFCSKACGFN
ncbi:unnamed protein product [Dicrocoelium dendriticum]|nr:unnamed protein product [Dicrocoelium dendriticum]